MASSWFPQQFDFSVWRGNSDEGADFTVTGDVDSDFTGYIGILRVAPLRGAAFQIVIAVSLGASANIATFKPRFTIAQTRSLDTGAVNAYELEMRNPDETWQKTCFIGKINGMGGLNLDV